MLEEDKCTAWERHDGNSRSLWILKLVHSLGKLVMENGVMGESWCLLEKTGFLAVDAKGRIQVELQYSKTSRWIDGAD